MEFDDSEKALNKKYGKTGKYFLFLFIFLALMEVFDTYTTVFPQLIPSKVVEEFQIEAFEYTKLVAWASLGMYFVLFIQFLADVWGRRIFLFITLLGMGIASILMYFSNSPLMFTFSLFLLYMFFSADIYTIFIAEEAPKEKRSTYTNLVMVFGVLGAVATIIFRMIFITDTSPVGSWRGIIYFAFLAIPLSFFVFKIKETTAFQELKIKRLSPDYKKENIMKNFWKPFQSKERKSFILILLISFIIGLSEPIGSVGELLLSEHFSSEDGTLILLAASVFAIISYLVTGRASDKFGRKKVFYVYSLIFPFSIALFTFGVKSESYMVALLSGLLGLSLRTFISQGLIIQTRILCVETLPTKLRGIGTAWRSTIFALGLTSGLFINSKLTELFGDIGLAFFLISLSFFAIIPLAKICKETKGIDVIC